MRALRRITTPVTVAALAGCSFPVDQLRVEQEPSDAVALTRADAPSDDAANDVHEAAVAPDDAATDAVTDACACVEFNPGGKCKKWEPPGCQ